MTKVKTSKCNLPTSVICVFSEKSIYYNTIFSTSFVQLAIERFNNTKEKNCIITVKDLSNSYLW